VCWLSGRPDGPFVACGRVGGGGCDYSGGPLWVLVDASEGLQDLLAVLGGFLTTLGVERGDMLLVMA